MKVWAGFLAYIFELQRSKSIEPGRLAATWAEVALHIDLDMPMGGSERGLAS